MNQSIYVENAKYIQDWITHNPNLNQIVFENNTVSSPEFKGEKFGEIPLKNFLVSTLLQNKQFADMRYTIKAKPFMKLLNLHIQAEEMLVSNEEETIQHIEIGQNGHAVVVTNISSYEIKEKNEEENKKFQASRVISQWQLLRFQYSSSVPFQKFCSAIGYRGVSSAQIPFFRYVNQEETLSKEEVEYIKAKSFFFLDLIFNQNLIAGNAQKLLELYFYEMNRLYTLENLNQNQKRAAKLYEHNLEIVEEETGIKKALPGRKASFGFSSLALIITAIISTGVFLFLLIF